MEKQTSLAEQPKDKEVCKKCEEPKEDCFCLPWKCESCKHKWKESSLWSFETCPKCGRDTIGHGRLGADE